MNDLERYAYELAQPLALLNSQIGKAQVACKHPTFVTHCAHCLAQSELESCRSHVARAIERLDNLSQLLGANQCPPEPNSPEPAPPLPGPPVKGSGGH